MSIKQIDALPPERESVTRRKMLQEDIITPEEYESICFKYADHFKPRTGSLVARNVILNRRKNRMADCF